LGPVAGVAQHAAQVDNLFYLDVLALGPFECLGLGSKRHQEPTVMELVNRCHGTEKRQNRVPLDVVARGVLEDLAKSFTVMAI